MTTDVQPWVQVGDGHPAGFITDDEFGLLPGAVALQRREEARLRAEEQRREDERIERADLRQQLSLWEARQYTVARGLEWDPQAPYQHLPNIYQRADAMFALQDMEQRRSDQAALRQAGLDHLTHHVLPHPGARSPSPGFEPEPPAPGSAGMVPVPEVAAQRHRYGLPRGKGEANYVRLRLARFRRRVEQARKSR
jgi:hypothetical protein